MTKTSDRCGLPCDNPKECPEKLPHNGEGVCEGYDKEEWANACPECVRDFGTPYSANCDCGTLCGDHCYKCHPPRDTKGRFVSKCMGKVVERTVFWIWAKKANAGSKVSQS